MRIARIICYTVTADNPGGGTHPPGTLGNLDITLELHGLS